MNQEIFLQFLFDLILFKSEIFLFKLVVNLSYFMAFQNISLHGVFLTKIISKDVRKITI